MNCRTVYARQGSARDDPSKRTTTSGRCARTDVRAKALHLRGVSSKRRGGLVEQMRERATADDRRRTPYSSSSLPSRRVQAAWQPIGQGRCCFPSSRVGRGIRCDGSPQIATSTAPLVSMGGPPPPANAKPTAASNDGTARANISDRAAESHGGLVPVGVECSGDRPRIGQPLRPDQKPAVVPCRQTGSDVAR